MLPKKLIVFSQRQKYKVVLLVNHRINLYARTIKKNFNEKQKNDFKDKAQNSTKLIKFSSNKYSRNRSVSSF